jgi:hypothetical protein
MSPVFLPAMLRNGKVSWSAPDCGNGQQKLQSFCQLAHVVARL